MWTEKDQLEDFLINMVIKDQDIDYIQNYLNEHVDIDDEMPYWGDFCQLFNLGDGIYDLGMVTKGFEFSEFWEKFKKRED